MALVPLGSELDALELPLLVDAALVDPGTHLGTVLLFRTLDVEHLLGVKSTHDLVSVDAPEVLVVAQLELVRAHAVTCNRG